MNRTFKTKPYVYEVKDVNKTVIKMIFISDFKREDCVNNSIIRTILTTCSNKYQQRSDYRNKFKELYIMDYYIDTKVLDDKVLNTVTITLPRLNLIEEFNLDEALKFIHDSLYDAFVTNKSFDEKTFNIIKENRIKDELDYPHSIHEYISTEFLEFCDEKHKTVIHRNEWLKALEKSNPKDLYKYYKKSFLDNNNIVTFITLNKDDKKQVLDTFNKYFNNKQEEFDIDINYHKYYYLKESKTKELDSNYNQCALINFYTFKDFNDNDLLVLEMLYYFLYSKENDLVFKELRLKRNLIYYLHITYNLFYSSLGMRIFFNKGDENKIKDIISNVFDMIRVEDNFNIYKEKLLTAIKYDYLSSSDNIYYEVDHKVDKIIDPYLIDLKEKLKLMKKITYKDMINLLDRMQLSREMIMYSKDGE